MPALTLEWDDEVYEPETYHPWTADPCGGGATVNDTWSAWIRYESVAFGLGDQTGIYVIEDPAGRPYYAGKALSFDNRFSARSRVFHEFGLDAAAILNYRIRIAEVTAVPNVVGKVSLAEHWLIRFLYCRDFANPPNQLQNIAITNWFNAPNDGLSIRYDQNDAPTYLSDPWAQGQPGWINVGGGTVGFNYAANAPVLQ